MSRSYKKTPYYGDKKNKETKRIANKTVRNYLKDPKHMLPKRSFKKVFESWDICDYGWVVSWEEYLGGCLNHYNQHPKWYKKPPNKKEEYRNWYKKYKMK